ncbi:MAG: glycerol acyltransferase [Prolixibacteraceae bacterium]|jgi:1-acyl-sn-glycerol-3-phosphate acyltransferase|nr:glycerol acyltransferase [Prolixibacteraceae bacterium]MBT6007324.1 glycerol acyltransferase [Prolixibacteraceae bacterium]MBT6766470.1 glycerol acyltransferase [Prolixibacteraceae bacterium]MBT7000258.1 glycerol acyltransferase [Prolixibacteraceae bacterium]MBT7395125.1 glycerol acyltransferase [Prolixibacteraceae bacterium]
MKTFSGKILGKLGWKIKGDFPNIKKSVTIFAPHTAHIDAIYGKLGFTELGVKYKFLSKKELFFFPMNLVMKKFGSIPVRGVKNKNAIYQVVDLFNDADELHIVVSPEGWIKRVTKWNKGFYYMASKAKVPIVVAYLDYKEKTMGVKGVIYDTDDFKTVMQQINTLYNDVTGKCPEQFALQEIE